MTVAKYSVPLTTWANVTVDVETDSTDPAEIVQEAEQSNRASLCNRCSGRENSFLEIGDEWTASEHEGKPLITRMED